MILIPTDIKKFLPSGIFRNQMLIMENWEEDWRLPCICLTNIH